MDNKRTTSIATMQEGAQRSRLTPMKPHPWHREDRRSVGLSSMSGTKHSRSISDIQITRTSSTMSVLQTVWMHVNVFFYAI